MEIALFGGSFNPPHRGHAEVIRFLSQLQAASRPQFDEIWVIPTRQHPFGKQLLAFAERMKLCQLMITDLGEAGKKARVSDVEEKIPGDNRTVDTLRELKRQYPNHRYTLILGTDLKRELPQWKDFPTLEKLATLYFIPRQGFEAENLQLNQTPFAPEISSQDIRRALLTGHKIGTLLTPSVATYIGQNGLYREPSS